MKNRVLKKAIIDLEKYLVRINNLLLNIKGEIEIDFENCEIFDGKLNILKNFNIEVLENNDNYDEKLIEEIKKGIKNNLIYEYEPDVTIDIENLIKELKTAGIEIDKEDVEEEENIISLKSITVNKGNTSYTIDEISIDIVIDYDTSFSLDDKYFEKKLYKFID